jgi:hypothetical protein
MADSEIENLKDYLIQIIDDFRKEFAKLDDLERKYFELNPGYSTHCQIDIFWVSEPHEFQLMVIFHNPNRPDKEIAINGPFNINQLVDKVIEIMDEPRWKEKAPYSESSRIFSFSSDAGDQEHKYSDEFVNHFSDFLRVIRQISSQYYPLGLVSSQPIGEIDLCGIFKGNIAERLPEEIYQKNSFEYARQYAISVRAGTMPDLEQLKANEKKDHLRKFYGGYYTPGARIGDNVELSFREKLLGPDIFHYPKYEYGFTFNGLMGFYDRYGLVLIENENESEAIQILNTIFGISVIYGVDAFSVRKSEIIESEIPFDFQPLEKSLGSYSRKISENTGHAPNFIEGLKKTQITLKQIEEIIRVSERVFLNEKLKDSLLFLLESNTHLKNSEFSQAYIFCWLIVEQYISKEFISLLSEKKEIEGKFGKDKDPNNKRNRFKLDILHSEEKLNDQEYSFLIGYNQKRNDFVHSGKTITQSDAETLFKFAFDIIQTEIRKEVA